MTTFFEYACLGILCLGLTMAMYVMVWLHGIPHHIAEANNHPHKRAIHVACWLSVFTLHAIWPFVYLWAMYPRTRLPVSMEHAPDEKLLARLAELEQRVSAMSGSPLSVTPLSVTPQSVSQPSVSPQAVSPQLAETLLAVNTAKKKDV